MSWVREGKRLGSAELRWASAGESIAVVASVGPVRGLAASLRGDSLAVALRRSNLFVKGAVRDREGADARLLRFLVEPWRFGAGWARDALARAEVEPCSEGYCLTGAPERDPDRPLRLVVSPKGDPLSLSVRPRSGHAERIEVRFGKPRRYAAGQLPRWVEWSWSGSRARLSIESHSEAGPGLKLSLRPDPGDSVYTLKQPRGREILRSLFDLPEDEAAR